MGQDENCEGSPGFHSREYNESSAPGEFSSGLLAEDSRGIPSIEAKYILNLCLMEQDR